MLRPETSDQQFDCFLSASLWERALLRRTLSPLRSDQALFHRTPKRVSAHAGHDHIAPLAKAGLDEMEGALVRPLPQGASAARRMRFCTVTLPLIR
ncbi:hypothetical protein [Rhizobium paranaense]|uniref:Uncharacterized protein n=1 Tax=Rhizobium paranaense TaxID=1650438 RepID=A0A7W9D528_9HYPH|nr:hypothetical protein [Rhizobium paranaense]MBB5577835.1 hypothetical protein [Rhizobium paranaense]